MTTAIIRYGSRETLIIAEVSIEEFAAEEGREAPRDIRALTRRWAWCRRNPNADFFVVRDTGGRTRVIDPYSIVSIETKEPNPGGAPCAST